MPNHHHLIALKRVNEERFKNKKALEYDYIGFIYSMCDLIYNLAVYCTCEIGKISACDKIVDGEKNGNKSFTWTWI